MTQDEAMVEDLVGQRVAIPSLPGTVAAILAKLDKEESGASEIAAVLACDPGLSAKALRIANSAFYGTAEPIVDIPRAVVTLGRATVRRLVVEAAILTSYAHLAATASALVNEFWMNSIAAAHVARAITKLRVPDLAESPDEMYSTALLMDVGSLVLLDHDAGRWAEVQSQSRGGDPRDLERAYFGIDHSEVAEAFVEAWGLPQIIAMAANLHHGGPVIAARASFAAVIRASVKIGADLVQGVEPTHHAVAVAQELGLQPMLCHRALESAQQQWKEADLSEWLKN